MSTEYADHRTVRIVRIGMRLLGAVFGGYALTALTVASAGAVLARLGVARSEALVLSALLGFVLYLALLLWAFSMKSVTRLWLALAAGAAASAMLLSRPIHSTTTLTTHAVNQPPVSSPCFSLMS